MRVWDLPTRLFHWLLVAAVAVAAATGLFGRESSLGIHLAAGYTMAALVAFRLVWGVFGSTFSRFSAFPLSPAALRRHLAAARRRRPYHATGHPPLGALMVVAILVLLAAITVTGLIALGGEEKQGLLAGLFTYDTGHAAKELHEAAALALLGLVAVHVLGLLVESRLGGENLVLAMITGRRRPVGDGGEAGADKPARPLAAAIALAVLAVGGTAVALPLAAMPPLGWRALEMPADYEEACAECHWAFHPSLLPADSWERLIAGLSGHFGEDASLAPETARRVEAWLTANAAETWDTEAANRLRQVSAGHPASITATPFWKSRHDHLPDHLFQRRRVAARTNCPACHRDAATGRFDDQRIDIPEDNE